MPRRSPPVMNRKLQPKGITSKALMKNNCLQIMLESAQVIPQETLVTFIRKSVSTLEAECIKRVKVYGQRTKEEFPDWTEEFEVEAQTGDKVEGFNQPGDDIKAIATSIEQWLNSPGIAVKVSLKNDCLQVKLESQAVAPEQTVIPLIRTGLINLGIPSVASVKVFAQQIGDDFPSWQQEWVIEETESLPESTVEIIESAAENNSTLIQVKIDNPLSPQEDSKPSSFWGSMTKRAKKAGDAIADATVQARKSALEKVPDVGGAISQTASVAGKVALETATGTRVAIAKATFTAGKVVVQKAPELGGSIANTALQTGKVAIRNS